MRQIDLVRARSHVGIVLWDRCGDRHTEPWRVLVQKQPAGLFLDTELENVVFKFRTKSTTIVADFAGASMHRTSFRMETTEMITPGATGRRIH